MNRRAWCDDLKKQWDACRPLAPETVRSHREPGVFTDFMIEREIETLRELIRLLGGTPCPEPQTEKRALKFSARRQKDFFAIKDNLPVDNKKTKSSSQLDWQD